MNLRSRLTKILTAANFLAMLAVVQASDFEREPGAKVFLLKTPSHYCTATLLLSSFSECRLVTNAHCFLPQETEAQLIPADVSSESLSTKSYFPSLKTPISVRLSRIDYSRDLAQLSLPEHFPKSFCDEITAVSSDSRLTSNDGRVQLNSFASIGYYRKQTISSFTQDIDWDMARGLEEIHSETSGLPGLSSLFQLRNLRMHKGMSGGVLIDQFHNVIGINVLLVPFQSESYFIPIQEVLQFLTESELKSPDNTSNKNTSNPAGDNAGGRGGDNAGGRGGDNAGGRGGDNAGGRGGDNAGGRGGDSIRSESFIDQLSSPLFFLREPNEGIYVTINGKERRLLAYDEYQVDGQDDYRRLLPLNLSPVFEDSESFKRKRSTLFERLKGRFQSSEDTGPSMVDFIFKQGPEWESLFYSRPAVIVQIKELGKSKALISLSISNQALRKANQREFENLGETPAQTLQWTASIDKVGRRITLISNSNSRLLCDNNNLYKLICVSEDKTRPEEFSISLNNFVSPVARIRYSKLVNFVDQKQESIFYLHGTLGRIKQ